MTRKRQIKNKIKPHKVLLWSCVGAIFIGFIALYLFETPSSEETDLSVIGQGENVIVQVHETSCRICRELKKNVQSLQPEFAGKIRFVEANLGLQEGKWFAQYHQVGQTTLLFFRPDGTKITTLEGLHDVEYLRRAFKRAFQIQ